MGGIVTIVQARAGSSRLPSKFAKPIAGRPMLVHVLERASAIGYPVWLATSEAERDDAVTDIATQMGLPVYRGIEWDVLGRMAACAQQADAWIVVRVTGDCPLLAPDTARDVIALYCQTGGIASNDTACSGWPDGLDVEVFPAGDLYEAAASATDRHDREHVTPWLRRHRSHAILPCVDDYRGVKLSVDTQGDLDRVRAIMGHLTDGDLTWPGLRRALLAWQAKGAA